MMRKSTINRITLFLLPLFGICPSKSCTLISRVFWIVTSGFIEYCHYCYFLLHLNLENFFDLIDCLCSFLAHMKLLIDLIAFWINQQKFIETLALITDDWSDCANSDIDVRMATCKAKISDRVTNIILILHIIAIIAYCAGIILADIDITETNELIFFNKLELPFRINTQHMYKGVLIAEFMHLFLSNLGIGLINTILLTLILHVGGQIDILQYRLEQLAFSEIRNEQESIITVNKIIQKHQKIIYFSENIESLYTYIALLLFVSNIALICSIGFLIVTAIGSPDATQQIIKCILFFTITNLEAYIYCYAGEYLNNKVSNTYFICIPHKNILNKNICILFATYLFHIIYIEQRNRTCNVQLCMVQFETQRQSCFVIHNIKIAEAINTYGWQDDGSFLTILCKCKIHIKYKFLTH
ncbi:odorant receptor 13a isoform X2 [Ooceraea biroi]|uniref:odorant receptor 13a isoform X2 n=1 Tax=Ooceraea biroi TaxID=2015173 RepID=UPI000F079846|nr:odorant receptor 13a isoform X2 [Ooceraea biroi]